jgi:hypothetical protein
MEENKNVSEAISEIKNATEEDLRETIEKWFESTRTDGMKIGAQFIAAGVMGKFKKHLEKPGKISLRDYERCFADIKKMLLVQLTEQNDSTEKNTSEEVAND